MTSLVTKLFLSPHYSGIVEVRSIDGSGEGDMYIGVLVVVVLGVVVEIVGAVDVGVVGEGVGVGAGIVGPINTGSNKVIRLDKLILPHPVTGSQPTEAL